MKVTVDKDVCIGAGMCVLNAPEVFDQDDDGTVVLLDACPGDEDDTYVREAAHTCPSGAITVTEVP